MTPGLPNKFLERLLGAALLLTIAPALMAQGTDLSSYQGPGILSPGVGDLGSRSGEQLDLRYYAGVSGVVDTNLAPFAVDAQGNLLRIHNLYGIEASGGIYGVHSWKLSQLGLDYRGAYHRYFNQNIYGGSDQSLTLGYTHQSSRRLAFDLRESVGTVSLGTSQVATALSSDTSSAFTPVTQLFDARTNFLQSTAFVTYRPSARTSYSVGGSAFLQDRKSLGLSNSWGYDFTGNALRRLSKNATLGVAYSYSHFESPAFQLRSDSNTYHGTYATMFGRFWTFSLAAGITSTRVESVLAVTLSPALAALFGTPTLAFSTTGNTYYPSGSAMLRRQFRNAELRFNYSREVNSGNGAYGTGRLESGTISISYTGIRRVNLGLDGGYYHTSSIGQATGTYSQFSGAAGFTYNLGHAMHLSVRYDLRDQHITLSSYDRTSTRASIGLLFSPGDLPLALW